MASTTGKKIMRLALIVLVLALAYLALNAAYNTFYKRAYPIEYSAMVREQADANDLPYDLVFAIIRTESGFRPQVESSVGARGLMQLTEETFQWIQSKMDDAGSETYADLYNPEVNIKYGTKLLRLLYDEFKTWDTVLCAYHAGWGSAKGWLANREYSTDGVHVDNIPFGDTKRYVKKVNDTREIYRNLYNFE